MFTKQEFKQNLLGCFEIFLFMPKGLDRFDVTPAKAIKSFLIPLAFLPLILAAIVGLSEEFSPSLVIFLNVLRITFSALLFLAAVYFLTKQFDRHDKFYKFLMVSNWLNINGLILASPILIGMAMGQAAETFEVYAVFIEIVGYVYSAFVITHCFRLPWELGGFIAIVGLAINENLFELSNYARDMLAVAV